MLSPSLVVSNRTSGRLLRSSQSRMAPTVSAKPARDTSTWTTRIASFRSKCFTRPALGSPSGHGNGLVDDRREIWNPGPRGIKEPQPLALKVAPGLTSLCDRGTTPRDDRLLGRHRYQNLPAPPSAGPIFLTQRVRLLWRRRARYSGFVAAS